MCIQRGPNFRLANRYDSKAERLETQLTSDKPLPSNIDRIQLTVDPKECKPESAVKPDGEEKTTV